MVDLLAGEVREGAAGPWAAAEKAFGGSSTGWPGVAANTQISYCRHTAQPSEVQPLLSRRARSVTFRLCRGSLSLSGISVDELKSVRIRATSDKRTAFCCPLRAAFSRSRAWRTGSGSEDLRLGDIKILALVGSDAARKVTNRGFLAVRIR